DRTGHEGGLSRTILLDHKKPSSMRSLGLDPCAGFWSLAVLFRRPVDVEWGRRDLNPDRRVSPTRGATHACCANHGSALRSVIGLDMRVASAAQFCSTTRSLRQCAPSDWTLALGFGAWRFFSDVPWTWSGDAGI